MPCTCQCSTRCKALTSRPGCDHICYSIDACFYAAGGRASAAFTPPAWGTQDETSADDDAAPAPSAPADAEASYREANPAGTAEPGSPVTSATPFPRPGARSAAGSTAASGVTPRSRLAPPQIARLSPDLMHEPAVAQTPGHQPSTAPRHDTPAHAADNHELGMGTPLGLPTPRTTPLHADDDPPVGGAQLEADAGAAFASPAQSEGPSPAVQQSAARPDADTTSPSAPADASNPFAELLQQGGGAQTAYPPIDVADISIPASAMATPAPRTHKRNPSWDSDAVRVRPQPVQPFKQARPELARTDPARAAAMQKSGGLLQSLLGQPRYQQQRQQQQQPGAVPQHAQPQYPPPAAAMRPPSIYASAPQFPPLAHGRTSSAGSDSDTPSPYLGAGQHSRSQSSTLLADVPPSQRREPAYGGGAPRAVSPMTNARSEPLDQDRPARAGSPQPFRSSMASPMRDAYARYRARALDDSSAEDCHLCSCTSFHNAAQLCLFMTD